MAVLWGWAVSYERGTPVVDTLASIRRKRTFLSDSQTPKTATGGLGDAGGAAANSASEFPTEPEYEAI